VPDDTFLAFQGSIKLDKETIELCKNNIQKLLGWRGQGRGYEEGLPVECICKSLYLPEKGSFFCSIVMN
jgi:hypothetical protein